MKEMGIGEEEIVSAAMQLYFPHPGVETREKAEAVFRREMDLAFSDPNLALLVYAGVLLEEDLLRRWKAGLGYLPQDPFFIDGTLRENLVWDSGGEITDGEIMTVLEQVNAAHLVARFRKGLDAFVVAAGGATARLRRQRR